MGVSLKIDTTQLKKLSEVIYNPALKEHIEKIPQQKAIAALIGQAIADNFDKEGPGWAALNPKTIRYSVSKKLRKQLSQMTDEEIVAHERKVRAKPKNGESPFRRILQRTGLLKKTVTTPNFVGSSKNGKKTLVGKNIYQTDGHNIIWGTDLAYAAMHNRGEGHVPKREFLRIGETWMGQIYRFMAQKIIDYIHGK